jgi:hypothetical protein
MTSRALTRACLSRCSPLLDTASVPKLGCSGQTSWVVIHFQWNAEEMDPSGVSERGQERRTLRPGRVSPGDKVTRSA